MYSPQHAPASHLCPVPQVFDFERWQKHRSSSRYMRHMAGMFSSSVVRLRFFCTAAELPS